MDQPLIPESEKQRKKHYRRKITGAGFIGAVIGAVVVGAALLFIYKDSLFSPTSSSTVTPPSESAISVQSDTVQVSSGVTKSVNEVKDAVVGIFNLKQTGGLESRGTGSGVIYKKEEDSAYIVTNHHVIEGANEIEVGLNDERVEAELVGSDPLTDLAVLRISTEHVDTVAEFGNSEALSVGEPAVAIGNPLGSNLDGTVTKGIISALDRSIPVDLNGDKQTDWSADVLQTDAAINPGNSGGALVNIKGQVIGINSMKIAQSTVEGIGFAIPSNVVVPVLEDLEENGKVERPQLGVTIGSLNQIPSFHWQQTLKLPENVKQGVFINSVKPNSPADEAGLQRYDVITSLNGEKIGDGHELRKTLYKNFRIGETIDITFYRNGKQQTTELTLGHSEEQQM